MRNVTEYAQRLQDLLGDVAPIRRQVFFGWILCGLAKKCQTSRHFLRNMVSSRFVFPFVHGGSYGTVPLLNLQIAVPLSGSGSGMPIDLTTLLRDCSYVHVFIRSRCAHSFRPVPQQGSRSPFEARDVASLFHSPRRDLAGASCQSLHSCRNRTMDKTTFPQTFQVFTIWKDQGRMTPSLILIRFRQRNFKPTS